MTSTPFPFLKLASLGIGRRETGGEGVTETEKGERGEGDGEVPVWGGRGEKWKGRDIGEDVEEDGGTISFAGTAGRIARRMERMEYWTN